MFIFGTFIYHYPIEGITNKLYEIMRRKKYQYGKMQASILGIIERFLYLISFLLDFPEFIGIWFTLKMVVKWKSWSTVEGRQLFNNFLIGNGISILFSICALQIYRSTFIENNCESWILMVFYLSIPFLLFISIKLLFLNKLNNSN